MTKTVVCCFVLAAAGTSGQTDDVDTDVPRDPAADARRLQAFTRELQGMDAEMAELSTGVGYTERGYFTSTENTAIQSLLFRYLVCRRSLWEMVNVYRARTGERPGRTEDDVRGFVVGFNAALKLAHYSSKLVKAFVDNKVVISKLNEAYQPYDIPRGTYDELFAGVTDVENLRALRSAWELFLEESGRPESPLSRLLTRESAYRDLVGEYPSLYQGANAQIEAILEARSLLLPTVRNRLRHTEITALVLKSRRLFSDNLYAIRGILFARFGRIRMARAPVMVLSRPQVRKIRDALAPGDIVLTYCSGYMSNVFLPGVFKHGITYVGTPRQRREAGLIARLLRDVPEDRRRRVSAELRRGELDGGGRADVIEAVAEGVIVNSLERILQGRVHRFVVLRPRLTAAERLAALKKVFLFLGSGYDFKFDFNEATYLCCTEVIYRAFHGKGAVEFPLVSRVGKQTLSADDILRLHSRKPAFDVVLLAQVAGAGAPFGGEQPAVIRVGADGDVALRELLAGE